MEEAGGCGVLWRKNAPDGVFDTLCDNPGSVATGAHGVVVQDGADCGGGASGVDGRGCGVQRTEGQDMPAYTV